MGKGYARSTALAILMLVFMPAKAWGDVFIGPRIGTLGVGGEVGVTFTDFFKLRGVVQGFGLTLDGESVGDVEYDFGMDLLTAGAILDFHPLGISPVGGSFRLSAGVFYNGNSFDLTSRPSKPVNVGGTTYQPNEVGRLDADVEFNPIAPYVGLGWGTSPGLLPIDFTVDLGVLYQGSPSVDLRSTNNQISAADLKREERDMEDDLSSWTWYPVIMLGVAFTF